MRQKCHKKSHKSIFSPQNQPWWQHTYCDSRTHIRQWKIHLCGHQSGRRGRPNIQPKCLWWVMSLQDSSLLKREHFSLHNYSVFPDIWYLHVLFPVPPLIQGNGPAAKELTTVLDSSINIECVASGSPPPQLNWLKNGLTLPVSSQIRLLSAGQVLR